MLVETNSLAYKSTPFKAVKGYLLNGMVALMNLIIQDDRIPCC